MNKRTSLSLLAALLLPLAAGATTLFLQDFGDVELVVHEVGGTVSTIEGAGGNIGVCAGADGVVLVDDQFAPLAPRIEAKVMELAGSKPVFVLNTHWHGDHTGGNAHFSSYATIIAHENVRRRLAGDPTIGGRVEEEPSAERLPVVTYADGVSVHFNGEEIRLTHVPHAHTDGDSVVWFTGSNVVHMGDLYFSENYPFIDLQSGGSVQGYVDGLDAVLAWIPEDARVIAGHGAATGVEELRAYRDMLATLVQRVRDGLDEGKTAAQMIEEGVSQDFDARWGGSSFVPPERFVMTLATDLAR